MLSKKEKKKKEYHIFKVEAGFAQTVQHYHKLSLGKETSN